jgi:hypothetical protein
MITRPGVTVWYVYIWFDWHGRPCYVGFGRGRRWLGFFDSDKDADLKRHLKETKRRHGDIPKIKVLETTMQQTAINGERSFIEAIGQRINSTGPLFNKSKGRGPDSASMIAWHASRSIEDRKKIANSLNNWRASLTPEQLSKLNRAHALSDTTSSVRMKLAQAKRTPAQRRRNARKGGAAGGNRTWWCNATPEQKAERTRKLTEARWPKHE